WATRRGLPRTAGHKAGVEALRAIIRECDALAIEALTIYAFSTENWSRSKEEVGALMSLLLTYFRSEIDELDEKNVCIRILGDVEGMPAPQREALRDAMARTGGNTGLKLNIALNYGGRDELLRAAKILARRAVDEGRNPESFTRADFEDALYTRGLPDVDLLIRTSGELRVSNFLPYQIAYAEFVVTDTLWPDFDAAALREAISAYQRRDRRFGGVKDN
ncbi:MAG: di-trans,poly-cis-decaprenylcistransferase, partial [Clostridia bacterium]|nr:di-trans,poly-cis-decaprenylcistransferase [Clostridia bacterium]